MKLLDRFRGVCAQRHFSPRTVECYEMWIRQFLGHFRSSDGRWRHPRELRGAKVGQFLIHLAQNCRLSASSQNQAMNAIVFLYKQVLVVELGEDHLGKIEAVRVRRFVRKCSRRAVRLEQSRSSLGGLGKCPEVSQCL